MTKGHFTFWTLIAGLAAVGAILYQHALHTNVIIDAIGGGPVRPQDLPTTAPQPHASGLWTPLGPQMGASVFPYRPPQNWQ